MKGSIFNSESDEYYIENKGESQMPQL